MLVNQINKKFILLSTVVMILSTGHCPVKDDMQFRIDFYARFGGLNGFILGEPMTVSDWINDKSSEVACNPLIQSRDSIAIFRKEIESSDPSPLIQNYSFSPDFAMLIYSGNDIPDTLAACRNYSEKMYYNGKLISNKELYYWVLKLAADNCPKLRNDLISNYLEYEWYEDDDNDLFLKTFLEYLRGIVKEHAIRLQHPFRERE